MKKIAVLIAFLLCSCTDSPEFSIGYTAPGVPVSITLDTEGHIRLSVGQTWVTPIGTFSIDQEVPSGYLNSHYTKVIIKETSEHKVYVFELLEGETFYYDDNERTNLAIEERYGSTVVTISSDEIDRFLKVARAESPKPKFPDYPIAYFWFAKQFNIDWSINSLGDLVLNLCYGVFFIIVLFLDLVLIIFIYLFLFWLFLILGMGYFVGSLFF